MRVIQKSGGAVDRVESAALLLVALRAVQYSIEEEQLELGVITKALEPYQKTEMLPDEWAKRDELEKTRLEIGERLTATREIEQAVRDALAKHRDPDAVQLLVGEGLGDESFLVRAACAGVLGTIGREDAVPALLRAAVDPDPRVRTEALASLGTLRAPSALEVLIEALGDDSLPVRSSAVTSLGQIGGKEAVGALIARMPHEDGRLRMDIAKILQEMTKQRFRDPRAWADWWKENEATLEATPGIRIKKKPPRPPRRDGKDGPAITYHGITTTSNRVVFILDISDSMNDAAKSRYLDADGNTERSGEKRSKFHVAREELKRAIKGLDKTDYFNIIVYNELVQSWQPKLLPALPSNIALALQFLNKLEATGGTNTFDSLEAAFHLGGFGVQDRYYGSKVDTLFLLSDGAPSAGRITDTDKILAEVRQINRLRKIAIHTVGIGHLADNEFLRELARDNAGQHVERY